jgi:tetratricopeptide (TPR) repeat protein
MIEVLRAPADRPGGHGDEPGRAEYERFRALAMAALEQGRLADALGHYESAFAEAREHLPQELVDRALCNRAAVAIALGDVDEPVPALREILTRNGCAHNCALAAYNIARAYELRKEHKKSLFYGRIALKRAQDLGHTALEAGAENQIGSALLADSLFEDAACCYERALELMAGSPVREDQLVYLANLGYCDVVRGRLRAGLRLLYRTLRAARAGKLVRLEMVARLDLCFAHLERGHLLRAYRHGEVGLALAEEVGEVDWIKNALYLTGEVAVVDGRLAEARQRFGELQQRFYPGQRNLPDFLVGVDIRSVINLRA